MELLPIQPYQHNAASGVASGAASGGVAGGAAGRAVSPESQV